MAFSIEHNRAKHCFETQVEGVRCVLEYTLAGTVMTLTHTDVPEAVGGRGIASALVRAALEAARHESWTVIPECSYVAVWMQRHPDFDDLRA